MSTVRKDEGSLILVLPLSVTLLMVCMLLYGYINSMTNVNSNMSDTATTSLYASRVLTRALGLLTAPGPSTGTDNCGDPTVAGTINNDLLQFRDFRTSNLTFTFSTASTPGINGT